jgi:hypothetical protein
MVQIANIVCMKWGTHYGAEYVNRLYNMVNRNMTQPFRFVCFTDSKEGISPEVEVFDLPPFKSAPLQTKGAYRKKTLCRSDLEPFETGERFLYLDIDIVIMDNIDDLFDYLPEEDFIICYNWTRGGGTIGNSSVTMMRKGPLQYIVDDMENNFTDVQNRFKTASQEFLSYKVIEKYGHLNFWPDKWCRSFQTHYLPSKFLRWIKTPPEPPKDTKIVLFHGRVNPPDAINGAWPGAYPFWKKWYKTVRPTEWISKYYK